MTKKISLDKEVPVKCRRMVRMLIANRNYHVSNEAKDAMVGALALRRPGAHNPLIFIKKTEPFAGVAFLSATQS